MKKIIQFSVDNPVTISMVVLGVLLLGYISFGKLGVDLFPDLNAPRIFIEIKSGEKPPEEIEKQFVENIEAQSIKQKGATQVSSICRVGSARITVEYAWDKDMDEAFLDLQKSLTAFSQNTDIDEFNITQHDPNATPVMIVGLSHHTIEDMNELRKVAENYIRNELVRLEGIADVTISGKEENEIVIETNNYLLDAHNITANDIAMQIQSFNKNVSGGSIVEMGTKYIIRGVSVLENLDDVKNIIVAFKQPNQNETENHKRIPVFLKDVAKVKYINKEPANIVRINQKRCLGLSIYKETKFNTVKAVNDLTEAFANIKKALPGYDFTIVNNQGEFINNSINEVKKTALLGMLIAVFILFIFLRRVGTTVIISIAIPISVVATFNLMYFNGLSLNIMTLGGLALGAGMLVDNAIIVMENILRNRESGLSVKEAAILGTTEVGGAITASTITTIVVFLPIVYLHGASGELFKDQAWTVAFSLLASLFVALFVIPTMFYHFNKKTRKNQVVEKKSIQIFWYGNLLNKIIDRRWLIIILSLILISGSILLVPIIGSEYIPKSGSGEFLIKITLPEGTQLERTARTITNIEGIITEIVPDEIETFFTQIGPATESTSDDKSVFENENTASIKITLKDDYKKISEKIITAIGEALGNIPDIEVKFVRDETALQATLGTDEAPIVVQVKGKDFDQIENLTNEVKQKMLTVESLYNVKTSIENGAPEIEVIIDRFKAGLFNMSVEDITTQIKEKLSGKKAGQFENEGEMKDITIKLPEISLFEFHDMILKNNNQTVRLDEVARIVKTQAPKEIYRRNQSRIGKVTAQIKKGIAFDHIVQQINNELENVDCPPDYNITVIGEEQKRKEAMGSLSFALLLSVILVYMVMASQFESLVHPFTILLTIPLAGVGAVLAFFFLGQTFNIMAYIGIIMLAGIAVNNSIILVDAINKFKASGLSRREAIIQAGQNRIRPIFMTSITTILALLPLTFGFGESVSLRAPMAIAVIGGLITSTLMTLLVIPCVYYVIDQIKLTKNYQ